VQRLFPWSISLGICIAAVVWPVDAQEPSHDAKASLEKLKAEVDALLKQRSGTESEKGGMYSERSRLQQELKELLQRIESRPPTAPRPKGNETPAKKFEIGAGDKPLDLLRSATNLFKDGDVDAALRTLRMIDTSALGREDRAFVKYMIATCLRRTGRVSEAATLYREVAESREDDFLAECAIWQLSILRSTQEFQGYLDRLRGKKK
jgi:tetratricopeptide (TPR) repeat protein